MENVGCHRRFDDVHALILRAMQRSPRDLVELMQGPEVSAMFDSDSADYEHIFTQWPLGGVAMARAKNAPLAGAVVLPGDG